MQDDSTPSNPFTMRPEEVVSDPFPYIVKENFLQAELYERLKREYPSDALFDRSSTAGARAGRDLYRGDADYDGFMAGSPAWTELHDYMNSPKFIELILELFGSHFSRFECYTDPKAAHFVDHVECRRELKKTSRIREKVNEFMMKTFAEKKANDLAVRMDLGQAGVDYFKPIHCDRPNRLITMIVYFCDADELEADGGDLQVHELTDASSKRSYSEYQRHPKVEDTSVIATVRPKDNLGIIFPCTNNSYHSVQKIRAQNGYRNFIYCSVYNVGNPAWAMK